MLAIYQPLPIVALPPPPPQLISQTIMTFVQDALVKQDAKIESKLKAFHQEKFNSFSKP